MDLTIQIHGNDIPEVDAEFACQFLAPYNGRTVVEMAPVPERQGVILIPQTDGIENRMRPDMGTVLAAGADIPLLPGDVVLVNHIHGKSISGFRAGEYVAEEEVRIYGRAAQSGGKVVKIHWADSILATLEWEEGTERTVSSATLKPVLDRVVVRRSGKHHKTSGGIELTEASKFRDTKGVVVAVGPGCHEVKVGDKVIYMAQTTKGIDDVRPILCAAWQDENLVMMEEDAALTRVLGENGQELTDEEFEALDITVRPRTRVAA